MRCSKSAGFLGRKKNGTLTIFRATCKQWSCPECSKRLRSQWRHHIAKEIQRLGFREWSFLTITAPSYPPTMPALEVRDKSYDLFKAQWRAFLETCIRQKYGKIQYIRCFELQSRGAVHAHALLNFHFDDLLTKSVESGASESNDKKTYSKLVNDKVTSYGFGFMNHAVNLEFSSSFNTAFYMSKYMNEEKYSLGFWLPKNARYLQMSQGFNAFKKSQEKSEDSVIFLGHNISAELHYFIVYDADKKRNVGFDDLDELGNYE